VVAVAEEVLIIEVVYLVVTVDLEEELMLVM
jgi:hypothetical protein